MCNTSLVALSKTRCVWCFLYYLYIISITRDGRSYFFLILWNEINPPHITSSTFVYLLTNLTDDPKTLNSTKSLGKPIFFPMWKDDIILQDSLLYSEMPINSHITLITLISLALLNIELETCLNILDGSMFHLVSLPKRQHCIWFTSKVTYGRWMVY